MIAFRKMNGLGNDFMVVDARHVAFSPSPDEVRALSDRARGVGFDQLIVIDPPVAGAEGDPETARMRILNADGGEVGACGNAARCVAALLLDESGLPEVVIGASGGAMRGWRAEGRIAIDMGAPRFDAMAIPLRPAAIDPLCVTFDEPELAAFGTAACVNVGNPHAVFFVPDVEAVPLESVGARLERHPVFPQRANISFVTVDAPDRVRARVFERGVGPTLACGTAACAIAAVGHRLGMLAATVEVQLPGGALTIAVGSGKMVMTGPWQLDWTGALGPSGVVRDPPEA